MPTDELTAKVTRPSLRKISMFNNQQFPQIKYLKKTTANDNGHTRDCLSISTNAIVQKLRTQNKTASNFKLVTRRKHNNESLKIVAYNNRKLSTESNQRDANKTEQKIKNSSNMYRGQPIFTIRTKSTTAQLPSIRTHTNVCVTVGNTFIHNIHT